jgi:hypothetical protein
MTCCTAMSRRQKKWSGVLSSPSTFLRGMLDSVTVEPVTQDSPCKIAVRLDVASSASVAAAASAAARMNGWVVLEYPRNTNHDAEPSELLSVQVTHGTHDVHGLAAAQVDRVWTTLLAVCQWKQVLANTQAVQQGLCLHDSELHKNGSPSLFRVPHPASGAVSNVPPETTAGPDVPPFRTVAHLLKAAPIDSGNMRELILRLQAPDVSACVVMVKPIATQLDWLLIYVRSSDSESGASGTSSGRPWSLYRISKVLLDGGAAWPLLLALLRVFGLPPERKAYAEDLLLEDSLRNIDMCLDFLVSDQCKEALRASIDHHCQHTTATWTETDPSDERSSSVAPSSPTASVASASTQALQGIPRTPFSASERSAAGDSEASTLSTLAVDSAAPAAFFGVRGDVDVDARCQQATRSILRNLYLGQRDASLRLMSDHRDAPSMWNAWSSHVFLFQSLAISKASGVFGTRFGHLTLRDVALQRYSGSLHAGSQALERPVLGKRTRLEACSPAPLFHASPALDAVVAASPALDAVVAASPAADAAAAFPTAAVAPPAADAAVAPPAADAAVAPPAADAAVAPPAADAAVAFPAADAAAAFPTAAVAPPAAAAVVASPAADAVVASPAAADAVVASPAAADAVVASPAAAAVVASPAAADDVAYPAANTAVASPATDAVVASPATDDVVAFPAADAVVAFPATDDVASPAADDEAYMDFADDGIDAQALALAPTSAQAEEIAPPVALVDVEPSVDLFDFE